MFKQGCQKIEMTDLLKLCKVMNFKRVLASILFAISILSGVMFFYSCEKDDGLKSANIKTNYEEFDNFISSKSYVSFSDKFKVDAENFDLDNLAQVQFQEQYVNLYQTLIYKKK